jgi:hypothetical protein
VAFAIHLKRGYCANLNPNQIGAGMAPNQP